MLPLGHSYAVSRLQVGYRTPAGVFVSLPDGGHSHVGVVMAVGQAKRIGRHELPLELAVGRKIIYSSRVDTFEVEGYDTPVDIVEEASVIGVFPLEVVDGNDT